MFGSDILEVAIGLAFVYGLFSLLCSALNEWLFVNPRQLRAQKLTQAICRLLGTTLGQKVLDHPLITRLGETRKAKGPSYIPAGIFADVLASVVAEEAGPTASTATGGGVPSILTPGAPSPFDPAIFRSNLKIIAEASAQKKALTDAVIEKARKDAERREGTEPLKAENKASNSDEQKALPSAEEMEKEAARPARQNEEARSRNATARLLSAVVANATRPEELRKRLEDWFHEAMDRVSGEYKRRVQLHLFWWSLGVALVFNVDTITLISALQNQKTLRMTLVAAAEESVRTSTAGETIVITTNVTPARTNISGTNIIQASTDLVRTTDSIFTPEQVLKRIETLKLPLGWAECETNSAAPSLAARKLACFCLRPNETLLSKFVGLGFSVAAISLGAPFWFGVLNKFINLRSSGPRPPNPKTENQK